MITNVKIEKCIDNEWRDITLTDFIDELLDFVDIYVGSGNAHLQVHLDNLKKFIMWSWNNTSPYTKDQIIDLVNRINPKFKLYGKHFKLNGDCLDTL